MFLDEIRYCRNKRRKEKKKSSFSFYIQIKCLLYIYYLSSLLNILQRIVQILLFYTAKMIHGKVNWFFFFFHFLFVFFPFLSLCFFFLLIFLLKSVFLRVKRDIMKRKKFIIQFIISMYDLSIGTNSNINSYQ